MMIDYVNRLKELQEDRCRFEKMKDKSNLKEKMNRQEEKYQGYIIDQMNDKNKIVGAAQMAIILSKPVGKISSQFWRNIVQQKEKSVRSKGNIRLDGEYSLIDESISVNFILVKLCTDSIKRTFAKISDNHIKQAFKTIHNYSKNKKTIQKMASVLKRFSFRQSFREIVTFYRSRNLQKQFFDESFSMIYKNDMQKDRKVMGGMSESCLSLIFDKQTHTKGENYYNEANIIGQQREEISSLQEDLAFMKSLLAQKTLELKKKTEECTQLSSRFQQNQQQMNDMSSSRNTSYLSQIQKQVTGVKRIRKNISRMSSSNPSLRGEEISRQLLSKYMKESFQLKENMDLARQLCLNLINEVKQDQKPLIVKIINVLSFGDENLNDSI